MLTLLHDETVLRGGGTSKRCVGHRGHSSLELDRLPQERLSQGGYLLHQCAHPIFHRVHGWGLHHADVMPSGWGDGSAGKGFAV